MVYVYLDTAMTLGKQISTTCQTAYMHMRRINSIRQYLTGSADKTIIQMIVVSRLDYCNSLYNGLPMKSIIKLQLAQNSAARIIDRTPRRAHMTQVLRDLHWLPIVKHCQYHILMFTYNVLHQNAPQYVCEMVIWYHPNNQLRSANTTSLVPHRHKIILYGRRLMDTGAAVLWNNLPNNIKCASSFHLLKTFENISCLKSLRSVNHTPHFHLFNLSIRPYIL